MYNITLVFDFMIKTISKHTHHRHNSSTKLSSITPVRFSPT